MKNRQAFRLIVLMLLAAHAVATIRAAQVPEPKEGKGLVVFYRLSSFQGKAIRFNINHAEGALGQLLSGTYIFKDVDPGEHTFWSQAISADLITLSVEAGKTYYIQGTVKMGIYAGRPKFKQVSESKAKEDMAKLK